MPRPVARRSEASTSSLDFTDDGAVWAPAKMARRSLRAAYTSIKFSQCRTAEAARFGRMAPPLV
jgi:hypothetical protein